MQMDEDGGDVEREESGSDSEAEDAADTREEAVPPSPQPDKQQQQPETSDGAEDEGDQEQLSEEEAQDEGGRGEEATKEEEENEAAEEDIHARQDALRDAEQMDVDEPLYGVQEGVHQSQVAPEGGQDAEENVDGTGEELDVKVPPSSGVDPSRRQQMSRSSTGTTSSGVEQQPEHSTQAQQEQRDNKGKEEEDQRKRNARRANNGVNPSRSLGDALREWERHLKMTQHQAEEEQKKQEPSRQEDHEEYQFVGEQEEGEDVEDEDWRQTLGDATQEQVEEMMRQQSDMNSWKDKAKASEEDGEDVGDTDAGDKDQPQDEGRDDSADQDAAKDQRVRPLAGGDHRKQPHNLRKEAEDHGTEEEMETDDPAKAGDNEWSEQPDEGLSALEEDRFRALHSGVGVDGLAEDAQEEEALAIRHLSVEELMLLREELEERMIQLHADPENAQLSEEIFKLYDSLTSDYVQGLWGRCFNRVPLLVTFSLWNIFSFFWCLNSFSSSPPSELTEKLRLIMEPTLASKLQGDFRSGKRINMKKVASPL
mgnify:FL=1